MRGKEVLHAMNYVNQRFVQEADSYVGASCARPVRYRNGNSGRKNLYPYISCFAAAACLCLALLGVFRQGTAPTVPGPDGPGAIVSPAEPSKTPAQVQGPVETLQPAWPQPQKVTINWDQVAVNEAEGTAPDYARRWYDPALYEQETWGEKEIVDYYGWDLAPAFIPEDLSGGGRGVSAGIYREKATGEIVQEQVGRGFWVDFWEDGGPKSNDDIVIPRGFSIRASKKDILHCALLPVEEAQVTQFDRTEVTLSHTSLPYGPFDPTRRDPSGLYNMPSGYYDIYTATFELDGVKYEVEAQRMELEEVIKIVASIIKPNGDMIVGVGCGMP